MQGWTVLNEIKNMSVNKNRRLSGLFKPIHQLSEDAENSFDDPDEELKLVEECPEEPDPKEQSDMSVQQPSLRRSGRKIIKPLPSIPQVTSNPVKLNNRSSAKDIEKFYLDKKVKQLYPSLETIFEEPQVVNNKEMFMSTRKLRRVINFPVIPSTSKNTTKVKKRKSKASKICKKKIKKLPIEVLMKKLDELNED